MSNGDFTVEFWMHADTQSLNYPGIISSSNYNSAGSTSVRFDNTGQTNKLYVYCNSASPSADPLLTSSALSLNVWHHVALVRNGTSLKFYVDGSEDGSVTIDSSQTFDFSVGELRIGRGFDVDSTNGYFKGYLTDIRLVKGTAVYTSAFTAPTQRLTAISGTSLLTCHLPYIIDGSTNGHAITKNGDTIAEPDGPYDYVEYTATSHGASMKFDGSGDYLTLPQTSMDLGSSNFCVEAWVFTTSTGNQAIVGSYQYADGVGSWNLNVNYNSNQIRFFIRHSGGSVIDAQFASGTFPTNQWIHVAVTRDGANLRAFINGTQAGSTNTSLASSTIDNASTTYRIGAANDNQIYWNGFITDVRVVKGSSVYTSDFTAPTSPLTAITNTEVLVSGTNANIIDKSQKTEKIIRQGDPVTSTTQKKYLTSSIHFDGNDYLQMDDEGHANFGTNDFTAEGWFWVDALPGGGTIYSIVDARDSGSSGANGWTFGLNASGQVYVYAGSQIVGAGGSVSTSTWYHWAFTRSGNTGKMFLDGTQVGTTNSSMTNDFNTTKFRIGANHSGSETFTGYQFDVRMTKNLARYTSNFTRPAAALEG